MRGPLASYVGDGLQKLVRRELFPQIDFRELEARFVNGALPWARIWQFAVLGHWVDKNIA